MLTSCLKFAVAGLTVPYFGTVFPEAVARPNCLLAFFAPEHNLAGIDGSFHLDDLGFCGVLGGLEVLGHDVDILD